MSRKPSEDLGKSRIEMLSDGIFAIVLTLLVLEIKVPHIEDHSNALALWEALREMTSKFLGWVISFLTICVVWLNHHRLFSRLAHLDSGMFWRNANLLLWCSFIPFPTALLGDYPENSLAVFGYGVVMMLMAGAFVLLRRYALHREGILRADCAREEFRQGTVWALWMGPVAYALGAAFSWFAPFVSIAIYAMIAVYFVFPHHSNGGHSTDK